MRNFLTKNEACDVLKGLENGTLFLPQYRKELASIRVCIAAEDMNFSFWGKPVEAVRPLFRECEVPTEGASSDVIENYNAYLKRIENAYKELGIKRE